MAVEIEGLEFQIEAKSENAAKGVDALINSFNKLKAATKGGAGLNNISKKLDAISNAKLSMSGIEKIEDLTKSLNSLSNVKISSTISKRITEIGASLDGLNLSGVEKVEALSTALQNMQGIQIPNMRNLTGNQTAAPTGTAAPGGCNECRCGGYSGNLWYYAVYFSDYCCRYADQGIPGCSARRRWCVLKSIFCCRWCCSESISSCLEGGKHCGKISSECL